MPLSIAPCNMEMEVRKISAEGSVKRRLMQLGIAEGCRLTLISSGQKGVIVMVKEGRLCLDGNIARRIFVA